MARGLNKHTILGNLGADPDVRYTQNNKVITRISVATTELVTSNGQTQEETEWHTVVLFGRRAEIGRDYLKKGSCVYIEGRVITSRWNDRQTGQQRSAKEIQATDMRLLDNPSAQPQQPQQSQQSQQRSPQQQRSTNQQSQQPNTGGYAPTDFDGSPANI